MSFSKNWITNLTPLWWQMTDISFENRNKEYGAFILRNKYYRIFSIAFLISIVLVVLILFIPKIIELFQSEDNSAYNLDPRSEIITEVYIPNLPKIEIQKSINPTENKIEITQKPVTKIPKVVKEDTQVIEVVEQPKPIEKIDVPTSETSSSNNDSKADGKTGSGIENGEDVPFHFVDIMPQFPGGQRALSSFLSNNLKYPTSASQSQIEGTVLIGFVVDKNGNIKNIKILKSLHYACDEEAIRVLKSMPQWIPGKHHGENVSVNYRIPIVYKFSR